MTEYIISVATCFIFLRDNVPIFAYYSGYRQQSAILVHNSLTECLTMS